jgi:hypothetical protein
MPLDEQSSLLCELEKKLHRPETRASADAVAGLLADEFIEFGASGQIWTRQQVIDGLARDRTTHAEGEHDGSEFRVHWLAEGVALVTYRGTLRMPSLGTERRYLRSSIWKRIDGQWRMVFHQGTPAAEAAVLPPVGNLDMRISPPSRRP